MTGTYTVFQKKEGTKLMVVSEIFKVIGNCLSQNWWKSSF